MKYISQTIAKMGQSVKAERFIQHGAVALRAVIKSDSYDFQSKASLEVWSPESLCWNFLVDIPYSLMETPPKLAYKDDGLDPRHFGQDFETLYAKALPMLPSEEAPTVLRTAEDLYVFEGGGQCPSCKSTDMDGGNLDADGAHVFQKILCNDCGAEWDDRYKLEGISTPTGFDPNLPLTPSS